MTLAAGIVFGLSLLGIVSLFALKRYEVAHQMILGSRCRGQADEFALRVKHLVKVIEWYLERTPDIVLALMRFGIHSGALGFARLARVSEQQAHRLADFVSHKRNFERRETKSEFLKQVGEYKNGNGKDDGPVASA